MLLFSSVNRAGLQNKVERDTEPHARRSSFYILLTELGDVFHFILHIYKPIELPRSPPRVVD